MDHSHYIGGFCNGNFSEFSINILSLLHPYLDTITNACSTSRSEVKEYIDHRMVSLDITFEKKWLQYLVHECMESSGCIGQSKRHHFELIRASL